MRKPDILEERIFSGKVGPQQERERPGILTPNGCQKAGRENPEKERLLINSMERKGIAI